MARWMVSGGTDSPGTRRSRWRSMSSCWVRRYSGRFIRFLFGWLKWFGQRFVAAPDQRFNAGFGFFELSAALVAEGDAALEELEGAFEREVAGFQFANNFFQFGKREFEFRYRLYFIGHLLHSNAGRDWGRLRRNI